MLCTCPLSSGGFLVERHQLPAPAPRRELNQELSERSCGLDNELTAGARHRHRPGLILILALLGRSGHSRIIPSSPQSVEQPADFLEFSGQDTQPLSWVMDICTSAPEPPARGHCWRQLLFPLLPAPGTARGLMERLRAVQSDTWEAHPRAGGPGIASACPCWNCR